jgi:hypothetical protein
MKALPSIAFNEFKGSAGDVTARVSKGRQALSARSMHSSSKPPAQAVSRNRLAKISRSYQKLNDEQMKAWAVLAEKMKGISTFGSPAELTPHNAFVRINSNLQMVGEPLMTDAPAYMNDVPEVLYDDLWISPEVIIFTGLQQPSESHVLVFKMSPALSPGVSSGWGQTVIITPDLAPDWGDADLTALYTSVMGVAPEAGKKYFCEFYWLDKKTGFTGESMVISAVCKESSTAYAQEYVPRVQFTEKMIANEENFNLGMDLELSRGSSIMSVEALLNINDVASYFHDPFKEKPAGFVEGYTMVYSRSSERPDFKPGLISVSLEDDYYKGPTYGFSHRAGGWEDKVEVFGTGAFVN